MCRGLSAPLTGGWAAGCHEASELRTPRPEASTEPRVVIGWLQARLCFLCLLPEAPSPPSFSFSTTSIFYRKSFPLQKMSTGE